MPRIFPALGVPVGSSRSWHSYDLNQRADYTGLLTIGMVLDIWTEKGNDGEKYETQAEIREANQHDFDVF